MIEHQKAAADRDYFRQRQAQHLELAERCGIGPSRDLHLRFADLYARRVNEVVVEGD